ncbi:MAG: flagellar motor switch protein FliN [Bryobacteraceae bacterium]|nr:flagellar motor switch protein FliN [Bryobacteraceae bacterium]
MNIAQWLANEWARQIGPALSSMTGEPYEAEAVAGGPATPPGGELRAARRLREAPEAEIRLAFSPEVWQACGSAILRAAGISDASEEETRGAFLEVVEQSLGQVSGELGRLLGREVSWEPIAEPQGDEGAMSWQAVELKGPSGAIGRVWMAAGTGFPWPASAAVQAQAPTGKADPDPPSPANGRRPMLELLMEVDLPVGVTFGRTQLKLKDAIKLTSGSIVELNRSIIEPVEVIVNNCVIARGEVVVIEGNYGVRIQEIVSREERLRTLF